MSNYTKFVLALTLFTVFTGVGISSQVFALQDNGDHAHTHVTVLTDPNLICGNHRCVLGESYLNPPSVITPSQYVIIISGYPTSFVPSQINIKVGDNLVFINQDASGFYGYETHRLLSINSKTGQPNGYFDSGTLYLGDKYVTKFSKPGNYTYIEALDPATSGQIIVTP